MRYVGVRLSVSRTQLFVQAGVIKIVEPLTDRVYKEIEKKTWLEDLESSPHGELWHTSFHASQFPGDDPHACGRKAVYSLLNVPNLDPTSRFLRSVADAGKSIENELVGRWHNAGILLSNPPNAEVQTAFKDEEYWLTGNCDAVILPYRWTRPHVVEVKSKADDKVNGMRELTRKWDEAHRNQCLTYIGLLHEAHTWTTALVCRDSWRLANDSGLCRLHGGVGCLTKINLDRCIDGTIFYVSRDNPSNTHEFTFSYDPEFMERGRKRLLQWREDFMGEVLPDRPRKDNGNLVGWSELPCKWCDMKKHVCKPDWQNDKLIDLTQSKSIEFTQGLRKDYDYDKTRGAVVSRWNSK